MDCRCGHDSGYHGYERRQEFTDYTATGACGFRDGCYHYVPVEIGAICKGVTVSKTDQ